MQIGLDQKNQARVGESGHRPGWGGRLEISLKKGNYEEGGETTGETGIGNQGY